MESILHTFGIDWRLLLVNAVNFGLLLAGLTYFLYKPVLKMLEDRRTKVAEGVGAAERAEERLREIEASRAHTLAQAGTQADEIVASARKAGEERGRTLVAQGEAQAASAIAEAALQANELKAQALRESKEEVAKLIVLGVERAMKK